MRQLIFIICGFCAISSYAQIDTGSINATINLSQLAMLDLEPNNSTVMLNLSSAIEAGEKAAVVMTNNEKWINFSSAVANNSRGISVKIADGQVPSGIHLKLSTSSYMGSGKGVLGLPANILTLNGTDQPIITGIKGAYTGNGINNGYKLTYSLEIYNYALLDFNQTAALSITLTLYDE